MKRWNLNRLQLIKFRPFLLGVLLLTGIIQFLIMYNTVKSDTYDIQVTQIAEETLRSTKTVEDVEKTEEARNEAEKLVEPAYIINSDVVEHRVSFIHSVFDAVRATKKKVGEFEQPISKEERITLAKTEMNDILNSQADFTLSDNQIDTLVTSTEDDLKRAEQEIINLIQKMLAEPIKTEEVQSIRAQVGTQVSELTTIPRAMLSPVVSIAQAAVIENNILDVEKTKERIEQARAAVEPRKILQGQIIVREGEAVTREMIRQLELLGMLDQKQPIKPIIGLALLISLQMAFLYIIFERSVKMLSKKRKDLLVTVIVYLLSIVIMMLINMIEDNFDLIIAFLFPTALTTMLVRILTDEKIASVVTLLTAASAGVLLQQSYASVLQMDIALYILFGGFGALYFMRNLESRKHLLQAVSIVIVINALFIGFYLLMSQASINLGEWVFYSIAALFSGLLSGALTMGLLPYFESAFGILSTMRLIELSNPNHPLFKKVLTDTPGTYHHSVMVANLAEAGCEAIGADGLLARVASYYHDVGKTNRPYMFIENQMSGVNPHDSLEPEQSAKIITAHTVEGAELLRKYKMPQEIIDIALQHHGTSALKYFLFKAKEQGKELDEDVFRYVGPKPQTKEAAVISIADSVEAAVRSMKEPTPEKIQSLIRSIIQDRLQDEQFDECDISIKELKKVEVVLCETLNGIFHSRIEYPK